MKRGLATALAIVSVSVSGCTLFDDRAEEGGRGPGQREGGPGQLRGALVREGFAEAGSFAARLRVELQRVERLGQYSVLRLAVTNLDSRPAFGVSMFGTGRVDSSFSSFRLVDAAGRKLYLPLREGSEGASAFGSRATKLYPGVRYQAQVYFPPVPKGVERITVITGLTTAEMTGVPVEDGTAPPAAPSRQPRQTPAPGQTVELRAEPPSGQIWSKVEDLYDTVDSPEAIVTGGGGGETVALPTDVLFAFDSAALSGRAQGVIAKAADALKARADASKPVSLEGHTDGKGSASYNQPLSERRAGAVRDALHKALAGQSYQFQVAGKADEEPVAEETTEDGADYPAGRARNRRVEIAYMLRPDEAPEPGEGSGPGFARGSSGGPAAGFRRTDGSRVAERYATVGRTSQERFRLRVYPFYRDGAFLVAAFELTNVGNGELKRQSGFRGYFSSPDLGGTSGADFGSFKATAGSTTYRTVRVGVPENEHATPDFLDGTIILGDSGVPQRTYSYLAAPPADVTSVTFDAGPFGKINNVPIR